MSDGRCTWVWVWSLCVWHSWLDSHSWSTPSSASSYRHSSSSYNSSSSVRHPRQAMVAREPRRPTEGVLLSRRLLDRSPPNFPTRSTATQIFKIGSEICRDSITLVQDASYAINTKFWCDFGQFCDVIANDFRTREWLSSILRRARHIIRHFTNKNATRHTESQNCVANYDHSRIRTHNLVNFRPQMKKNRNRVSTNPRLFGCSYTFVC